MDIGAGLLHLARGAVLVVAASAVITLAVITFAVALLTLVSRHRDRR